MSRYEERENKILDKNANQTMEEQVKKNTTFWDHLDEFRKVLFRIALIVCLFTVGAFLARDEVFGFVLAPSYSDFITYRGLCTLSVIMDMPSLCPQEFHVELINTLLAEQFLIHMRVSFYAGLLVSCPYIIYQLFGFISPALYRNEKKYSSRVVIFSLLLFACGVALSYLVVFPFSFRFLATYQVSEVVRNTITISSYVDTFMLLSLLMGLVFEIPVVAWLLAKLGMLRSPFMKKYRRHALLFIVVIAAIITPTTDIFTLLLVSVPMWMLYEFSIWVVRRAERSRAAAKTDQQAAWEDNPYHY